MPGESQLKNKIEEYKNGGSRARMLREMAVLDIGALATTDLNQIEFEFDTKNPRKLKSKQSGKYYEYYRDPSMMVAIYQCLFRSLNKDVKEFLQTLDEKLKIFDANGVLDEVASRYHKSLVFTDFIKRKRADADIRIEQEDLDHIFQFIVANKLSIEEARGILGNTFADAEIGDDVKAKIKGFFCDYLQSNLQEIGWFNAGSEDVKHEAGDVVTENIGVVRSFETIKSGFDGELVNACNIDEVFNHCQAEYDRVFKEQYNAKMLYFLFIIMDERHEYRSRQYGADWGEYHKCVAEINDLLADPNFDVKDYFKQYGVNIHDFDFLEKIDLSDSKIVYSIKTELKGASKRVNYGDDLRFLGSPIHQYILEYDLKRFSSYDIVDRENRRDRSEVERKFKSYYRDFYDSFTNRDEFGFALLKTQIASINKKEKRGILRNSQKVMGDRSADIYVNLSDNVRVSKFYELPLSSDDRESVIGKVVLFDVVLEEESIAAINDDDELRGLVTGRQEYEYQGIRYVEIGFNSLNESQQNKLLDIINRFPRVDIRYIDYLDDDHFDYDSRDAQKNIKTRSFININKAAEAELISIIQNPDYTEKFAKYCRNPKYKSLAASILSLRAKNQEVDDIDVIYKKLLEHAYEKSLLKDERDIYITPNLDLGWGEGDDYLDASAIVPIFEEIIASGKNISANSLHLSLADGSDFRWALDELKRRISDKDDYLDLKGRPFPIAQLVINCNDFLMDGVSDIAEFQKRLSETLAGFDALGVRKLRINSGFGKLNQIGIDAKIFGEILDAALLDVGVEVSFEYCYQSDESVVTKEKARVSAVKQRRIQAKLTDPDDLNIYRKIEPEGEDPDEKHYSKGHQFLFGSASYSEEAEVHEDQEQEQEMEVYVDQNEIEDYSDKVEEGVSFEDEDLVSKENIALRMALSSKDRAYFAVPKTISQLPKESIQDIWDEITGGSAAFNDQSKKLSNDDFRIDKMTKKAALMLLKHKVDGRFAGGLNLRRLPQGFYMARNLLDNKIILDFDITRRTKDSAFIMDFADIDSVLCDEPGAAYKKEINDLVNEIVADISLRNEGSDEFAELLHTNLFRDLAEEEIDIVPESKFLEVLNKVKNISQSEFNLLLHLLKNNLEVAPRANAILLVESFLTLKDKLHGHGVVIQDDIVPAIKQKEDLRALSYRILEILKYVDKEGVCEVARESPQGLKQRIFNEMLQGKISLAEHGMYHALYCDGLINFDAALAIDGSEVGIGEYDDKISYLVSEKSLFRFLANNLAKHDVEDKDLQKATILFLRYVVTPVQDRVNEFKVSYENAKAFIGDFGVGLDPKKGLRIIKLFLDFKVKHYEQGLNLVSNLNGVEDLDVFCDIVNQLKSLRPSFTDIARLAKLYAPLDPEQKADFAKNISDIVSIQPDWRYFSRIIENLVTHTAGRNYSFSEICSAIQLPPLDDRFERDDYHKKFLAATLLKKSEEDHQNITDVPWSEIVGGLVHPEGDLVHPKLKTPDSLIPFDDFKTLNYNNLGSYPYIESSELVGFNYDYFSLDHIKLQFQEGEDLRVIDAYYKRKTNDWSFTLELKNESGARSRMGAKYLNFLNEFDTAFRIDFLRVFIGDKKVKLKEERLLRDVEKNIDGFFKKFLAFDYRDDRDGVIKKYNVSVSSRQQIYATSFKVLAKLYHKFPSDAPVLIGAFYGGRFDQYQKGDDKIKFLHYLGEFLDVCSRDFSLNLFEKYASLRFNQKITDKLVGDEAVKKFLLNIVDNEFVSDDVKTGMLDLLAVDSHKPNMVAFTGTHSSSGLGLIVDVNQNLIDKISSKKHVNQYNIKARPLKEGEENKIRFAYEVGSRKFKRWSKQKLLNNDVLLVSLKLPITSSKEVSQIVYDIDDFGTHISIDVLKEVDSDDVIGFFVSGHQHYVRCADLRKYCERLGEMTIIDFKNNIANAIKHKDAVIIYKFNNKKRALPISELSDDITIRKKQISDLVAINSGRFLDVDKEFLSSVHKKILAHNKGFKYKDFLKSFKEVISVIDAIDDQLYVASEDENLVKKFPGLDDAIVGHKIRNYANFYKRRFYDLLNQLLEYDDDVALECVKKIEEIFKSSHIRSLPGNVYIKDIKDLFTQNLETFWNSNGDVEILFLRAKKVIDNCKGKELEVLDRYVSDDETVKHIMHYDVKVDAIYLKIKNAIQNSSGLGNYKDRVLTFVNGIFYQNVNISNRVLFKRLVVEKLGDKVINLIDSLSDELRSASVEQALTLVKQFENNQIFVDLDRDPNLNIDFIELEQFDDSKTDLANYIDTLIGNPEISQSIKEHLSVVDAKKYQYFVLGKSDLMVRIQDNVNKLKSEQISKKESIACKLDMLALLRESYRRVHGKYPYTTQLLPLIYFVTAQDSQAANENFSKIMAEISTGQGKSLLSSIYVSFQALNGKASHVTSSTDVLSKRDFRENQNFYSYLGLKSHYIDNKGVNPNGDEEDVKYEKGRIYHSTASNFYFFLSKNRLSGEELDVDIGDRSWLSDETDTLLDNKTLWRLSVNGSGGDDLREFYYFVNDFYDNNAERIDRILSGGEPNSRIVSEFKEKLEREYEDLFSYFKFNICVGSDKIVDDKIALLLSSAKKAAHYTEDNDFTIQQILLDGVTYNCARILKKPSNEPDLSSTWGDGVHPLLHARLERSKNIGRFILDKENVAITSGTPKQLVEYCGNFVGITGTMGRKEDLELISNQFGISHAVKVQPHQLLKRKDMGSVLIDGGLETDETLPFNDKQFTKLRKILSGQDKFKSSNPHGINHNRVNNQPVLIICENVAEAKLLYQELGKNAIEDIELQIIDGSESDIEMEKKIKKAGRKNVVTISTPISGRGTDIRVSADAKKEGLYTILMSVFNERETAQAEGRSGRNGDEGKTISLINANKKNIKEALQKVDFDEEGQRKYLDSQERIHQLREVLFAKHRENLKKQVAESVLIEEKYREFCFYRSEFLKQAKLAQMTDVTSLTREMENLFANFLNNDMSVCLKKYKMEDGKFDNDQFAENVTNLVEQRFELFLQLRLFPLMKVKCEKIEELPAISQEFKKHVQGRVQNKMLALQQKIDTYKPLAPSQPNEKREKYSSDDELYGITGLYLRQRDPAPADDLIKDIYIQAEGEVQHYQYKPLSFDGYYSHVQQHMIHFADLASAGFRKVYLGTQDDSVAQGDISRERDSSGCYISKVDEVDEVDEMVHNNILAIYGVNDAVLMKNPHGAQIVLLPMCEDIEKSKKIIRVFFGRYDLTSNIECIAPLHDGSVAIINSSTLGIKKRHGSPVIPGGASGSDNRRGNSNIFDRGARVDIIDDSASFQSWNTFQTKIAQYCHDTLLDHERLSEFQTQNLFIRSYIAGGLDKVDVSGDITSDFRNKQLIADNKAYGRAISHIARINDGTFGVANVSIASLDDVSVLSAFDNSWLAQYVVEIQTILQKLHHSIKFSHLRGDEFEISCDSAGNRLIETIAYTFGGDVNKTPDNRYRISLKGINERNKFLNNILRSTQLLPPGFNDDDSDNLSRSYKDIIFNTVIEKAQISYREKVGRVQRGDDGKITEEFKANIKARFDAARGDEDRKSSMSLRHLELFLEINKRIIERSSAAVSELDRVTLDDKYTLYCNIDNGVTVNDDQTLGELVKKTSVADYAATITAEAKMASDYDRNVKAVADSSLQNRESRENEKKKIKERYKTLSVNNAKNSNPGHSIVDTIVKDFKEYAKGKVGEFRSLGIDVEGDLLKNIDKDNIVAKDQIIQKYNRVAKLIVDINAILRKFDCNNVNYQKGEQYLRRLRSKLRVDEDSITKLDESTKEAIDKEDSLSEVAGKYRFNSFETLRETIKDEINSKLEEANKANIISSNHSTINVDFAGHKKTLELYNSRVGVRDILVKFYEKINAIDSLNSNSEELTQEIVDLFSDNGVINVANFTPNIISKLGEGIGKDELQQFINDFKGNPDIADILNDEVIKTLVKDIGTRLSGKRAALQGNETRVQNDLDKIVQIINDLNSGSVFSYEVEQYQGVITATDGFNFASLNNIAITDQVESLHTAFQELQALNNKHTKAFEVPDSKSIITNVRDEVLERKITELSDLEHEVFKQLTNYLDAIVLLGAKSKKAVSSGHYNSVQINSLLEQWQGIIDSGVKGDEELEKIFRQWQQKQSKNSSDLVNEGLAQFTALKDFVGNYGRLLTLKRMPVGKVQPEGTVYTRIGNVRDYLITQKQDAVKKETFIRDSLRNFRKKIAELDLSVESGALCFDQLHELFTNAGSLTKDNFANSAIRNNFLDESG
ncbi:MAG: hypothetical protein ISQ34_00565, partial [Rickettsiales bacterium]|nr:hypothetical protein [Rickettsiales bacterium]